MTNQLEARYNEQKNKKEDLELNISKGMYGDSLLYEEEELREVCKKMDEMSIQIERERKIIYNY